MQNILLNAQAKEQRLSTLIRSNLISSKILKPDDLLHVVVTVPKNLTVTVIDDLHEHNLLNTKIECLVEQDAHLTYQLKAIDGVEHAFEKTKTKESQEKIISREIIVRLIGSHAKADVKCLCFGNYGNVFKFKTLQDHQATDSTSSLVIKSVLDGNSRLHCHNLIKIQKDAQRSDAEQLNKNILLSNDARAISIPMLEIEADDVRCQHGAAISKLDDDHLFYLQSRGLDLQATKKMLIEAFLN